MHGARSSERRRDARRRYARRWLCPQGARSLDTLAACDPSTLTHSAVRLLHLLLRNPFNAFPGADASEAACETMEAVHAAQDEGVVDKLSVEGASSQPASNSCRHPSSARRSRPCARSAARTEAGARAICGWLWSPALCPHDYKGFKSPAAADCCWGIFLCASVWAAARFCPFLCGPILTSFANSREPQQGSPRLQRSSPV